jgi:hypothetical protein
LTNFGVERYDDLADAFAMMVNQVFATSNGRLNHQDPICINSRSLFTIKGLNRGEDWADIEDREILRKTNKRATWGRIIN